MESLLCNEVWPMSPDVAQENNDDGSCNAALDGVSVSLFDKQQDCEEAFGNFVDKGARCMPDPGYLKLLMTNDSMRDSRFKAVNWLIKSKKRLDLTLGTIFIAANNLDRFVSLSQCQGWKDWMFELLSIACLSVASKFNETATFPLCEFQGDGLNHSFAPIQIQRMELTLLKCLGWRMASTTPFTYIEFLIQSIDALNDNLVEDLSVRVTQLLTSALLDPKFLEFQPLIVATSAVGCVFGDFFPPEHNATFLVLVDTIISQDRKDDLSKCQRSMGKLQDNNILACGNSWNGPSSPVTVLLKEDSCLLSIDIRSSRKRKREEQECGL